MMWAHFTCRNMGNLCGFGPYFSLSLMPFFSTFLASPEKAFDLLRSDGNVSSSYHSLHEQIRVAFQIDCELAQPMVLFVVSADR